MKDTMRKTLLQLRERLQAKQMSQDKIRWMLEGVVIRAGYEIGLLRRGEPIPESIYRQVSLSIQEIMQEQQ
jgi:hypothetical protein